MQAADVINLIPSAKIVETSMKSEEGISDIEELIEKFVYSGEKDINKEEVMITNARHEDLLRRAKDLLAGAADEIEEKQPLDIVEIDVKEAYELLGEIIGESVTDDIINEIFSRFCLGK